MADTVKVLGQVKPSAATLATGYTVPGATSAVLSSILVCNQSATATSYRISIAVAGAADTPAQYVAFDRAIGGNMTHEFTVGISLAAADVVRVYNTLATLSFGLFGVEIT